MREDVNVCTSSVRAGQQHYLEKYFYYSSLICHTDDKNQL